MRVKRCKCPQISISFLNVSDGGSLLSDLNVSNGAKLKPHQAFIFPRHG